MSISPSTEAQDELRKTPTVSSEVELSTLPAYSLYPYLFSTPFLSQHFSD